MRGVHHLGRSDCACSMNRSVQRARPGLVLPGATIRPVAVMCITRSMPPEPLDGEPAVLRPTGSVRPETNRHCGSTGSKDDLPGRILGGDDAVQFTAMGPLHLLAQAALHATADFIENPESRSATIAE